MKLKDAQVALGLDDDIREYTLEETKSYYNDMIQIAEEMSRTSPMFYRRNFYLVLILRPNPNPFYDAEGNVYYKIDKQVFPRFSAPTPVYKQIVFKYHYISSELEFLWNIPDKEKYYHILKNKQKYYENKETRQLCQFVVLMESGELLNWVKKENGELPDAVIQLSNKDVN